MGVRLSDSIKFEGLFEGVKEIIHSVDMDTMLWNAATDVISNLDEEDYNISLASVGLIKVARIDTATKRRWLKIGTTMF